jgi:hypothetical protein
LGSIPLIPPFIIFHSHFFRLLQIIRFHHPRRGSEHTRQRQEQDGTQQNGGDEFILHGFFIVHRFIRKGLKR